MTEQRNRSADFAADAERSRLATALYVVGLAALVANSALYFFGADALSHPAVSVLALALLVPLYLRER